jgi:hypothetical protein
MVGSASAVSGAVKHTPFGVSGGLGRFRKGWPRHVGSILFTAIVVLFAAVPATGK